MKEKNFISAVIYVRNDVENVIAFSKQLLSILSNKFLKYEIIFVNDASTDKTVDEIKEYAKTLKDVSVNIINMSFYQGKEVSMNAGVDFAIGDFVYQFDTTLIDYDLDIIFKVYEKALEGYDIVNAVPNKRKRLSSTLFYKIFNKNSNFAYEIGTETFQILSRRAINRIYAANKTVPYRKAVQANSGLKIANISYKVNNNTYLKIDKNLRKERSKNAINSIILFTDISYKITLTLSIIMFIFAFAVILYTVYIFFTGNPVEGWTPIMLLIASGFFGLFLILTAIIKYLAVILNLIFKKSDFLIESIEKVSKN